MSNDDGMLKGAIVLGWQSMYRLMHKPKRQNRRKAVAQSYGSKAAGPRPPDCRS